MGKNKRKRSHTKHVFVQKKYRDALFRRIFNEKPVLLELYNALNQTDYSDADEAEGTIPVIELTKAIEIVKGGGVDDNPNSNNDYRPDM